MSMGGCPPPGAPREAPGTVGGGRLPVWVSGAWPSHLHLF